MGGLYNLLVRQNPTRPFGQADQQLEFSLRKLHRLLINPDAMLGQVDPQIPQADSIVFGRHVRQRGGRRLLSQPAFGPLQLAAHRGQQLSAVNRLGQIIIHAQFFAILNVAVQVTAA